METYSFAPSAGKRPTPAEIEQLGLAVADGRARYYLGDGSNKAGDWARSVSEAARSGRPFFVNIRPRILTLDADNADQTKALEPIRAMLETFGIVVVIVASGQPDRAHLFALIADNPALKALAEQMAREAGIDVRTGQMIRPPLSPHRLGPRYQPRLISPATPAEAVAVLTAPVTTRRIMSARPWRLLEKGDTDRRWLKSDGTPDRSRAIASWVSEAIRTGFDDNSIKRLLRDPDHALGEKVREKDQDGEGEKWLDLTIREERDWLADNPRVKIDAVLDGIEARAFDNPEHWRRRGGASAFAVLMYFLTIARKVRSLDFGASRRDAMLWTGIADPKTFRRATRKLVAYGYIRQLPRDPDWETARFELLPPFLSAVTSPIQGSSRVQGSSTVLVPEREKDVIQNGVGNGAVPEVFRHRGLGLPMFFLWLVADSRTEVEVAKALHTRPHRVRPRLATLERYGLVGRTDDNARYWRFGDQLAAAADRCGVAGYRARQLERIQAERQAHAERRGRKIAPPPAPVEPVADIPDFDVPVPAPVAVCWFGGTLRHAPLRQRNRLWGDPRQPMPFVEAA